MTTQYGLLYRLQAAALAAKPVNLACKDFKNLTPDVSYRRI
ncbi:DMSO reductase iron-sulfur subunit [Cedecea neteri]|uniref:DMSO reductase iron-sulfur subunit n=1 Tax=Cedecea neteri TaxID=158822 RepID=A0A2X2T737_9ENTR|nr:DMSO reductase iron-sulfur subunit [Cedecea neteri]